MYNLTRILSVVLVLVAFASNNYAGKCTFFTETTANNATDKFQQLYLAAEKRFMSDMALAKKYSASKGDFDEVKKIELAIAGKSITDFTSVRGKSARQTLDSAIRRVTDLYLRDLNSAIKTALSNGGTSSAKEIQKLITQLKEAKARDAISQDKEKVKRFTIYAQKDWQQTQIKVEKGDTVHLRASGKWCNGARKKIGRKKWQYIYGDADSIHYEARVSRSVADQVKKNLDSSATFKALKSGTLEFRMTQYRKSQRADAKGTMSLKILVASGDSGGSGPDLYLTAKHILRINTKP